MNQILNQIGELVLGSVPTIVLFLLLIVAYAFLVQRPLKKVLRERHSRTSGAVEQAKGAIAAAEAQTSVYEDKLRAAKAEIFEARDEKLKRWNSERDAALQQARTATQQRTEASRKEIEDSATAARQQIEASSAMLGSRILRAVLPASAAPLEGAE